MSYRPYRIALAHPRTVLAVALLLTLAASAGLGRLRIRTDGRELVPPAAPELAADDAMRRHFQLRDRYVIVLETEHRDGIYNPDTLRRVVELSAALQHLEGIDPDDVVSLATEKSYRVRPGTSEFRSWLDPLPETERALSRLRDGLRGLDVYRRTLISNDTPPSATAILAGARPGMDRRLLTQRVRQVLTPPGPGAEHIHLVGAPVAESSLGDHLLADLARLIPIAVLVMAAVFWLCFRRLAAVALPLAEVGACLLVTLSLMGWCGVSITLPVAALPVLLTAIGVADEIHLLAGYRRDLRRNPGAPHGTVLRSALERLRGPICRTSLTSALAFATFALAPVGPVRAFGVFMAIGIGCCLLWTLFVTPACLVLLPPGRVARLQPGARSAEPWFGRLAAFAVRHRTAVLVGGGLVAALTPVGIARLQVQDGWTQSFAPKSTFYTSTQRVNELFGGTHLLRIEVDAGAVQASGRVPRSAASGTSLLLPDVPGVPAALAAHHRLHLRPAAEPAGWRKSLRVLGATREAGGLRLQLDPGRDALARWLPTDVDSLAFALDGTGRVLEAPILEHVGQLERFLASRPEVGAVLGPHVILRTLNALRHARRPGSDRIPTEQATLQQLVDQYVWVQGEKRFHRLVDAERQRALLTVFVREANFEAVGELLAATRRYAGEHLEPLGVSLRFGGDVAVSQGMIAGIVHTQVLSLLLSLLVVAALAAVTAGSLRRGLLVALPAALAILVDFAVMGLAGIPLGVATSMFSAMTIGIGVDYAIHLLARHRQLGSSSDSGHRVLPAAVLPQALQEIGPAIAVDAAAIGLGFGVLLLSQVPSTARLGGLVALSLATCLLATLLVVPAVLGTPRALRTRTRP